VATLDGIGTGGWIFLVVITVVAAVVAFRWSKRFALRTGTTPWRVPSALWAAAAVLSPLIGLVLLTIAVRTTRLRTPPPIPAGYPVAPVPAAPAPLPLAGWYPDPSGRFLTRYWDGGAWSDQVHDGVKVGSDPPD
jgi:hypothetical protein